MITGHGFSAPQARSPLKGFSRITSNSSVLGTGNGNAKYVRSPFGIHEKSLRALGRGAS